jgi:hypothetical protein
VVLKKIFHLVPFALWPNFSPLGGHFFQLEFFTSPGSFHVNLNFSRPNLVL